MMIKVRKQKQTSLFARKEKVDQPTFQTKQPEGTFEHLKVPPSLKKK